MPLNKESRIQWPFLRIKIKNSNKKKRTAAIIGVPNTTFRERLSGIKSPAQMAIN